MSAVEPAATGADQGKAVVAPQEDSGAGGGEGAVEAQLAIVSYSGDEVAGRREYGDEGDTEGEAATVHGSKEGTEELLRMVVYSEEAAYKLYCDYGHRIGFSIRKGKQSYFTGTKRIRTKDYFCSKEGLKEGEKLTDANFNDPHTRTNCKAMVRFRVNDHGEWKVIRLVSDHNHNLARPEERHLLRSARSLIAGRSSSVEAMIYAGYQVQALAVAVDKQTEDWREKEYDEDTSCSKFETMGLLCPHALKALSINNACKVPEIYILKRWTKDAKKWFFNPKQYEPSYQECMDDEAAYCKYVTRFAYDLVIKSQGQELRKSLWETLETGEKELEKYLENVTQCAPSCAT
ncbi:hypothetical protein PR202_ga01652 [Eleusine coracana subsp. coracana]|uniref:FAR1 domain-containing protein n=1 Tax=Eleusine coracana subsp. coracana TaxID=191504 RepID=A0AAV5BHV8_ELECO|nr:hypothetical protein PR202_ga00965 [Eleusine coracana subsp. coracana]GJM85848.1 hypothetical protein PR202_ga01652 [Eleusine coracana subsp. coracana]